MIKQVITLIGLSILIVLAMSYAQNVIQVLLIGHDFVSDMLTYVFSGGQVGSLARGLIALLTIPVCIALVPSLIYWLFKRNWFPYFMEIVWVVWLIQAGALLVKAI